MTSPSKSNASSKPNKLKVKEKEKVVSVADEQVQDELEKLSFLITSIELMHNEAVYSEQTTVEELG